MKQILTLSLLLLSLSCTNANHEANSGMPITVAPVFQSAARATPTAFEAGDQIGLYVLRSVENAKFTASADGLITSSPAVYYPDPKDPVSLRAYYPYNSSVTDPTKFSFTVTEDLKKSDLCYAQTEALPSKEAQALPFKHTLSRVVLDITTNSNIKSVTSVKFINTATDLTLNIETGAITLGSPSKSLAVNNSEAIVPPQTFAAGTKMLEITVKTTAGVSEVYYYTPLSSIILEQGKSHSFSFTLGDDKTVILNGSPQIAAWTAIAKSDIARKVVSNNFTVHWLIASPKFATVNKVMLTVKDSLRNKTTKLTVDNVKLVSGSSIAAASYTFDFAPAGLNYPYTIQSVEFYNGTTLINSVIPNISATIYKTGASAFGVEQKAVLTLSAYSASVAAQTTSAAFTLTSNVPYSSVYTTGGASAQGTGNAPPYNAAGVTFTFPAQGAVAVAAKTHTMTITPAVDYLIGSQKRTFTVTQAAVPCTFTLSPATASVGAQVTSAAFTLSSNNKYTSTYTTGGSSTQGIGNTPPYTNTSVTFNFPAQGTAPKAVSKHIMTVKQTAAAVLSPKSGTFTVTQAAVPPAIELSSYDPNVTIPKGGATYYTNITSNTTWSATATNAIVTASGYGNVNSFAITANPNYVNSTRIVSITFTTTGNAGQAAVSRVWSGMQAAAVPSADCWPIPLPDTYVYVANTDVLPISYMPWQTAVDNCAAWGGRLPTLEELLSIYNNKFNYGTFVDFYYWTSTPSIGSYNIVNLTTGHVSTHTYPTYYANVRCVKGA